MFINGRSRGLPLLVLFLWTYSALGVRSAGFRERAEGLREEGLAAAIKLLRALDDKRDEELPSTVRGFSFDMIPGTYVYDELDLEIFGGELNTTGVCPGVFKFGEAGEPFSIDGNGSNALIQPLSDVQVDGAACAGDGGISFVNSSDLSLGTGSGLLQNLAMQTELLVGGATQNATCGAFPLPTTSMFLLVFSPERSLWLRQIYFKLPANTRLLLYVVNGALECIYVGENDMVGSTPLLPSPFELPGTTSDPLEPSVGPPEPSDPEPYYSPELYSPEPYSPEPSSPEPYSPEPSSPEPYSPEPYSPEPSSPEPSSPELSSPEPYSPETYSPETYSPEPCSSELCSSEPYSPEPSSVPEAY